ncbi:hypothetical protein SAMN05216571_101275 [Onishia taeanensis]|uniref:Uncharacterized protein n=1 Tax=Onishia taeanensis TaxID=284577 RepID=A0A1G7N7P3_9GAMM|nr:hypothetical protein [Halomonas taeanensis]SDF70063.1 hypothetical protein SAMN05216571_101275 [Halomonas taeanensis]
MSADRQRLVAAIRRIAKTDPEISSALAATGVRGDQPATSGIGVSSGADSRQCCGGSEASGGGDGDANPGTEQTDSGAGGQSGGLDSDDPARLSGEDGKPATSLDGLTDCATGQPVSMQMGGGDWVPPEGWGDASQPPASYKPMDYGDAYEEGMTGYVDDLSDPGLNTVNPIYGWIGSVGDVKGGTAAEALARLPSTYVSESGWKTFVCSISASEYEVQRYGAIVDEDGELRVECPGAGAFYKVVRVLCSNYSPEEFPNCGQAFDWPTEEAWPEDGAVNLAIKSGSIVGSKYDPENDGSYSMPRNSIELCDGDGNSILLEPTQSGGWRSIKSLGGEPDPDTVGYEYNGRGEIVRVLSTGEWKATGQDPRNF